MRTGILITLIFIASVLEKIAQAEWSIIMVQIPPSLMGALIGIAAFEDLKNIIK